VDLGKPFAWEKIDGAKCERCEVSQRFDPTESRREQDSPRVETVRLQDAEEERRHRLAALHALAEQALQAPAVIEPKSGGAHAESRVTSIHRMPTSWRGSRRRRRRRVRIWRVSLVVVLPLVLISGSLTFALRTLRPGASSKTTERLVASVSALYFDPDVPWTTVSVDNRSVSMGKPGDQAPFVLPAGRHLISWEAAPFPPQQCVLSSPAASTDTCPAAFEGIAYAPGEPAAEILRLEAESNDLPQANFGGLTSSIQMALTTSEQASPVYRGEPVFLGGLAGPGVADGTYTATTRIQLDSAGSLRPMCQLDLLSATQDCDLVSNQCLPLCSLDFTERQSLGAALPSDQWLAIAAVSMWRDYESRDGGPEYPYGGFAGDAVAFDAQAVLVGLHWQGSSWQVQVYLGTHLLAPSISNAQERILVDPACATAEAYFAEDLTSTEREAYSQVRFVSGANPSAGCLIQATAAATGEQVKYFERFGVLLALNTAAQHLHPTMPVAATYVQNLASQLAGEATSGMAMRFPASGAP
jgi:hypothetical protein